jgi:hypothetical protein
MTAICLRKKVCLTFPSDLTKVKYFIFVNKCIPNNVSYNSDVFYFYCYEHFYFVTITNHFETDYCLQP